MEVENVPVIWTPGFDPGVLILIITIFNIILINRIQ